MTRAQVAGLAGATGLALVALFAGEYSTLDWLKLREHLAEERDSVAALRVVGDSLRRAATALETDPAALERKAREKLGMIRDGEFLYRIVPDQ